MASSPDIDAVVFDLDGVLVDSEQLWDATRRGVVADAGKPWPEEATTALQGMSTPEWAAYLGDELGVPGDPREIADRVIDAMVAHYDEHLPLLPGAVAAVERIAAQWTLGLASSSPRRLIDAVLARSGLDRHFAETKSTEECSAGKPSPEVYLTVARLLQIDPHRSVAIEDSSNGLRSAAAAGMFVLAVPHEMYPPAPDARALASGSIDHLDDLTPALIESLAARKDQASTK